MMNCCDFCARIDRQNDLISNAHRSVSETEEVGMEITAELARNREKIESSRAKVVYVYVLLRLRVFVFTARFFCFSRQRNIQVSRIRQEG